MHPHSDKFLSGDALALRDFGFVMREDVIDTAAVKVDLIAEQRSGHRAALNMPTRPAWSPWRLPFHITIVFVPGLPKCEIANVFLVVFVVADTSGRLQLCQVDVRK